MKKLFLLCLSVALYSCSSERHPKESTDPMDIRRVEIVENNTITYITLSKQQGVVIRLFDTVWVNLATHRIDDTCSTAMKGVIRGYK